VIFILVLFLFVGISTHGVIAHIILVFLVMGMILLIGFQRRFMDHWKVCTFPPYHVTMCHNLIKTEAATSDGGRMEATA
jgi:hypothetical protein